MTKITAIKLETVDGKRVGKSYTFDLDPKKMARHKTEAALRKKIEEHIVKMRLVKPEDLPHLKYDMAAFLEEWKKQRPIVAQEEKEKQQQLLDANHPRNTAPNITDLKADEIFVFGSNAYGNHLGGAARTAVEKFGAIMGRGHGLQGHSYAIDSMSGPEVLRQEAKTFAAFAKAHPEKRFLVTLIGCGIAGYTVQQVAPMFEDCRTLGNVSLPMEFWMVIGRPELSEVEYNLQRFVDAQDQVEYCSEQTVYEAALAELKRARKSGHWIWYIFPQPKGLGHSANSQYYGLLDADEARCYYAHPILGERLQECCRALLLHAGSDINKIMGPNIDVEKVLTCMNTFYGASHNPLFKEVIDTFYNKD